LEDYKKFKLNKIMNTENKIPSQEWLEKYEEVKSILVPPVSFEETYSLIVFHQI